MHAVVFGLANLVEAAEDVAHVLQCRWLRAATGRTSESAEADQPLCGELREEEFVRRRSTCEDRLPELWTLFTPFSV